MNTKRSLLFLGLVGLGLIAFGCNNDRQPGSTQATSGNEATGGNANGAAGDHADPAGGAAAGALEADGGGALEADGGVAVASRPYTDYDVNHILMTGQSNSVSNNGVPVLTTTQPYGNLMFNTGVMPGKGSLQSPNSTACDGDGCVSYDTPNALVPLTEGDEFFSYAVETAASSIANEASFLVQGQYKGQITGLPDKHDMLMSLHGRSGNTYWCLRKGGCPYKVGYEHPFDQAMAEVQSGMALSKAAGKSYVVRGVMAIHGESDHYSYTTGVQEFPNAGSDGVPDEIQSYSDALLEWQHDYETSVTAITHQTEPLPLFISQLSGWNDAKTSAVANYQLDAHIRSKGKVVLIGPAYPMELGQVDCLHYLNVGEQHLGEMFGKVYAKVVLEGKTWEPLRPKTVTRNGSELDVQFYVPVPPLVLDTTLVAEIANYGFEYLDAAGTVQTISSVAITGPDTVKIMLASAPAANGHLTYAQNQTPGTCIGPQRGARGNIRDSDATPSRLGFPLYNWTVNFDVVVP